MFEKSYKWRNTSIISHEQSPKKEKKEKKKNTDMKNAEITTQKLLLTPI